MGKLITLKWKNIAVEVAEKQDIKYMDDMINDLVIPFKFIKSASAMFASCYKKIFIDVADLRIPVVLEDYCDTQGCTATVRVSLPSDHPLRKLIRKAVEETWLETVKSVKIPFYGEAFITYSEGAEPETVYVECDSGEQAVFQAPLKTLKRNLEKALKNNEELTKAIEDTLRLVEEVEKQLTCEEAELELEENAELLKKGLRKTYLSVLRPRDELDVEF